MDHPKAAAAVPPQNDTHMGKIPKESQVPRSRVRCWRTICVLRLYSLSHRVIDRSIPPCRNCCPRDETGTVQSVTAQFSAALAPLGGHPAKPSPLRIPSHHMRLSTPEVTYLPHQTTGGSYKCDACRVSLFC